MEEKRKNVRFWKNFIGNWDTAGVFYYSTKKFWFTMTSVAAVIAPTVLLICGNITGKDYLDYIKWVFAPAIAAYTYGKTQDDKRDAGNGGGNGDSPVGSA